eukprot:PhF_6_TR8447/c0_g1_i1/m.13172
MQRMFVRLVYEPLGFTAAVNVLEGTTARCVIETFFSSHLEARHAVVVDPKYYVLIPMPLAEGQNGNILRNDEVVTRNESAGRTYIVGPDPTLVPMQDAQSIVKSALSSVNSMVEENLHRIARSMHTLNGNAQVTFGRTLLTVTDKVRRLSALLKQRTADVKAGLDKFKSAQNNAITNFEETLQAAAVREAELHHKLEILQMDFIRYRQDVEMFTEEQEARWTERYEVEQQQMCATVEVVLNGLSDAVKAKAKQLQIQNQNSYNTSAALSPQRRGGGGGNLPRYRTWKSPPRLFHNVDESTSMVTDGLLTNVRTLREELNELCKSQDQLMATL